MTDPPLIPSLPPRNGEMKHLRNAIVVLLVLIAFVVALIWKAYFPFRGHDELLHVSFDASKSYFGSVDSNFKFEYVGDHGYTTHSAHAGSVQQAMGITSGLIADIVSFASPMEIEEIRKRTGCINEDWQEQFPFGSSPFTSVVVFLVRKGNPKGIEDWNDLIHPNIQVITSDPSISGVGRYSYLASLIAESTMQDTHPRYAEVLFRRIQILPMGARSVLKVFLRDKTMDVLITWESLAIEAARAASGEDVEVVYPSISVKAEPVVTLVNCNVERRHTRQPATAYIDYLFSDNGQQFAALHGWRPRRPATLREWQWQFQTTTKLVSIEEQFGSWDEAWQKHFSKKGSFQQIVQLRQAQKGGSE